MKSIIVLLHDDVNCVYSAPLSFANDAAAKRWFANNKDPYKKDYEMIKVGEYNDETGDFVINPTREIICRGLDYENEKVPE